MVNGWQRVIGGGSHLWAAPYERDDEFGGRGLPAAVRQQDLKTRPPGENTTLVVVATAALTKAQARRVAIMAQDGMARASGRCIPRSTATSRSSAHGRAASPRR